MFWLKRCEGNLNFSLSAFVFKQAVVRNGALGAFDLAFYVACKCYSCFSFKMKTMMQSSLEKPVITIGHTPDADDAFMFYAITRGLLESPQFQVAHVLKGIQLLNEDAAAGVFEMSAISFGAYPGVADKYSLMPCGACMGLKYGPMVLSKNKISLDQLRSTKVAIPGKRTSAYLALQIVAPGIETVVLPFDQIAPAVQSGDVEAGLVISEAQLLYEKLGLHKVVDLGEWWYEETKLPLPLGGNIIRKDVDHSIKASLIELFQKSIKYALSHREEAVRFAMTYARGMDFEQALKFVGMYVNELTVDYGEDGRQALQLFYDRAFQAGALEKKVSLDFALLSIT